MSQGAPFHDEIQCCAKRIEYDFAARQGQLWTEEGDCTDLSGTTELFARIDPKAEAITVYSGARLDIYYIWGRGAWEAREPAERPPANVD